MSRLDNARKGIVAGFANNILNVILPFISRTIIIYTLGNAYTGLGGLFTSIIQVLSISELGFGAAVSYILYKPIAEGDDAKVRAILNFTKRCFRIIGLIILMIGLAIMPFLHHLIKSDIPNGLNIYILFVIYLLNVVLGYLTFAYKRLLFSANQRYDVETIIGSVTLIAQYVLQIIVLLTTKNYYLFVVVTVVTSMSNNIMCHIVTKRMFPQYFCEGQIGVAETKVLKKTIGGSFFAKVGETISMSLDNIIVSAFFGLVILGRYGNYLYVITALVALFAILHNTLRPIIGNCIVVESKQNNFTRFSVMNHMYLWCSIFCACCLLVLYQDFITVWVGEENLFSMWVVILLVASFLLGRTTCVPVLFVEAAGLWWECKFFAIIGAATKLLLSLFLSKMIGLPGMLIASMISTVAVTLFGYTTVLFKHYFVDKRHRSAYIKNTAGTVLKGLFSIGAVYLVVNRIPVYNFFTLVVKGLLTVVAFAIVYIVLNFKNKNSREGIRTVLSMLHLKH